MRGTPPRHAQLYRWSWHNWLAHTLPELITEDKLISGHTLDVMMQGRNWDYYAQVNESRPQQQPEQNGDHLSECQEGVLTKHPRHRHWAVQELAKSNNAPATG